MGFFNFIETFFFLSLGITFVLILLLVYHFKQRLTTLENKCDTVFEIISNLVKEVSNVKQMQMMIMQNPSIGELNTIRNFVPSMHNTEVNGRIKVSDEDFEEDEDSADIDEQSLLIRLLENRGVKTEYNEQQHDKEEG